MPAVINAGAGGDLNPGLGGSADPAAATSVVRQTSLSGTGIANGLSAQTSYNFDQFAAEARVVCATPAANPGDTLTVIMGAGNNVQRFGGTVLQVDTSLAPHAITLMGKSPLYLLEQYRTGVETLADDTTRPGIAFEDLVGAQTATLQQIVVAVLNAMGVSFSTGNFANPSHIYGTLDTSNLTWGTHETAAAYLGRIFAASAGYRLFDSTDGNTYLRQVSAIPAGSPDATLTLGIDIFGNSQSTVSTIGQYGAVLVQGFDDGSGPATSGIVGTPTSTGVYRVGSDLIETDAFAAELAAFWLTQVNRRQSIVRLSTPRDDLFGPAQTHYISAGPGLGVTDTMFLKSVTTELAPSGEFVQNMVYIAGTTG